MEGLTRNLHLYRVQFWKDVYLWTIEVPDSLMYTNARILKAHSHSHSMSWGSIWASLECQCCFWIAGGLVSYLTMWLLTLQLFKNSIDTQEKLRLNLHSLSATVLLEYGRKSNARDTPCKSGHFRTVKFFSYTLYSNLNCFNVLIGYSMLWHLILQ
jgi:hypothetical protein